MKEIEEKVTPKKKKKLKKRIKLAIRDIVLIILGIFSASLGLKGFLLPVHFIDGGATGIALLLSATTKMRLAILIIFINIPFIVLGFKTMGAKFGVKAALSIFGLAIALALIHFPVVTKDKLLVAVFGGFFLGAGIGLAVRGGAVLDGMEIFAIYISKKIGTSMGDTIIGINVIIFSVAAYLLGIDSALYSLITYIAASKTLDFLVEGIESYIGVTIIARKSEEIRRMIIETMGRGVTVYKGKGGYGKEGPREELDILYTVITRLELNKLKSEINEIEPEAFVVMTSVKETKGGVIKKRPLGN